MTRMSLPIMLLLGLALAACQSTGSAGGGTGDELGSTQHLHRHKGHIYDKGP